MEEFAGLRDVSPMGEASCLRHFKARSHGGRARARARARAREQALQRPLRGLLQWPAMRPAQPYHRLRMSVLGPYRGALVPLYFSIC